MNIPKGKIYRADDGWRVRGWMGVSATKAQAVQRYKAFARRESGFRIIGYGLKQQWEKTKKLGGILPSMGAMLSPNYNKTSKQIEREFARKIEKRRSAEIRALKQKRLTGWF